MKLTAFIASVHESCTAARGGRAAWLWCGGLGRRWSSIWTPILMKPGNAEFLLVFRLRAPSMRCHASGELFLGGLWAGIAVRRLVRPANPTRIQYLRVVSGQLDWKSVV